MGIAGVPDEVGWKWGASVLMAGLQVRGASRNNRRRIAVPGIVDIRARQKHGRGGPVWVKGSDNSDGRETKP